MSAVINAKEATQMTDILNDNTCIQGTALARALPTENESSLAYSCCENIIGKNNGAMMNRVECRGCQCPVYDLLQRWKGVVLPELKNDLSGGILRKWNDFEYLVPDDFSSGKQAIRRWRDVLNGRFRPLTFMQCSDTTKTVLAADSEISAPFMDEKAIKSNKCKNEITKSKISCCSVCEVGSVGIVGYEDGILVSFGILSHFTSVMGMAESPQACSHIYRSRKFDMAALWTSIEETVACDAGSRVNASSFKDDLKCDSTALLGHCAKILCINTGIGVGVGKFKFIAVASSAIDGRVLVHRIDISEDMEKNAPIEPVFQLNYGCAVTSIGLCHISDSLGGFDGSERSGQLSTFQSTDWERRERARSMDTIINACEFENPEGRKNQNGTTLCIGCLDGRLLFHHRGFVASKDTVLHSKEGPITSVAWCNGLIAWGNSLGVKIYSIFSQLKITFVPNPQVGGESATEIKKKNIFHNNRGRSAEDIKVNCARKDFKIVNEESSQLRWIADDELLIMWSRQVNIVKIRTNAIAGDTICSNEEILYHKSQNSASTKSKIPSDGLKGLSVTFAEVVLCVTLSSVSLVGTLVVRELLPTDSSKLNDEGDVLCIFGIPCSKIGNASAGNDALNYTEQYYDVHGNSNDKSEADKAQKASHFVLNAFAVSSSGRILGKNEICIESTTMNPGKGIPCFETIRNDQKALFCFGSEILLMEPRDPLGKMNELLDSPEFLSSVPSILSSAVSLSNICLKKTVLRIISRLLDEQKGYAAVVLVPLLQISTSEDWNTLLNIFCKYQSLHFLVSFLSCKGCCEEDSSVLNISSSKLGQAKFVVPLEYRIKMLKKLLEASIHLSSLENLKGGDKPESGGSISSSPADLACQAFSETVYIWDLPVCFAVTTLNDLLKATELPLEIKAKGGKSLQLSSVISDLYCVPENGIWDICASKKNVFNLSLSRYYLLQAVATISHKLQLFACTAMTLFALQCPLVVQYVKFILDLFLDMMRNYEQEDKDYTILEPLFSSALEFLRIIPNIAAGLMSVDTQETLKILCTQTVVKLPHIFQTHLNLCNKNFLKESNQLHSTDRSNKPNIIFPVPLVVDALHNDRQFLHAYLKAVRRIMSSATKAYTLLQIELYIAYEPHLLVEFLRLIEGTFDFADILKGVPELRNVVGDCKEWRDGIATIRELVNESMNSVDSPLSVCNSDIGSDHSTSSSELSNLKSESHSEIDEEEGMHEGLNEALNNNLCDEQNSNQKIFTELMRLCDILAEWPKNQSGSITRATAFLLERQGQWIEALVLLVLGLDDVESAVCLTLEAQGRYEESGQGIVVCEAMWRLLLDCCTTNSPLILRLLDSLDRPPPRGMLQFLKKIRNSGLISLGQEGQCLGYKTYNTVKDRKHATSLKARSMPVSSLDDSDLSLGIDTLFSRRWPFFPSSIAPKLIHIVHSSSLHLLPGVEERISAVLQLQEQRVALIKAATRCAVEEVAAVAWERFRRQTHGIAVEVGGKWNVAEECNASTVSSLYTGKQDTNRKPRKTIKTVLEVVDDATNFELKKLTAPLRLAKNIERRASNANIGTVLGVPIIRNVKVTNADSLRVTNKTFDSAEVKPCDTSSHGLNHDETGNWFSNFRNFSSLTGNFEHKMHNSMLTKCALCHGPIAAPPRRIIEWNDKTTDKMMHLDEENDSNDDKMAEVEKSVESWSSNTDLTLALTTKLRPQPKRDDGIVVLWCGHCIHKTCLEVVKDQDVCGETAKYDSEHTGTDNEDNNTCQLQHDDLPMCKLCKWNKNIAWIGGWGPRADKRSDRADLK